MAENCPGERQGCKGSQGLAFGESVHQRKITSQSGHGSGYPARRSPWSRPWSSSLLPQCSPPPTSATALKDPVTRRGWQDRRAEEAHGRRQPGLQELPDTSSQERPDTQLSLLSCQQSQAPLRAGACYKKQKLPHSAIITE